MRHRCVLATALLCCACTTATVPGGPASSTGTDAVDRSPEEAALSLANASPKRDIGMLTSATELRAIRAEWQLRDDRDLDRTMAKLIRLADRSWTYGTVGTAFGVVQSGAPGAEKRCTKLSDATVSKILPHAGEMLFSKMLAYHLTDRPSYAQEVRNRLLDISDASGFERVVGIADYTGANQCALDVGLAIPMLIESAYLLESWAGWTQADKRRLQAWLAAEPYRMSSAIAATRKNNWGTSAAFASWSIARYLEGSNLELRTAYPERITRTPAQAKRAHVDDQLRVVGTRWRGDSRCERFGVQWHGGFPDELRRGSTGCDGTELRDKDGSYSYQIMVVSHLAFHAEALARDGSDELYDYLLGNGVPLLLGAIRFVIDNPSGRSHDWKRHELGALRLASQAFDDPKICEQLARSDSLREGQFLPYVKVVRPDACS